MPSRLLATGRKERGLQAVWRLPELPTRHSHILPEPVGIIGSVDTVSLSMRGFGPLNRRTAEAFGTEFGVLCYGVRTRPRSLWLGRYMEDRPSEPPGNHGVPLWLGPDSAGQITFWMGIPAWTLMAVLLGYLLPPVAGVLTVMWVFAVWYSWRAGFRTSIMIDHTSLKVNNPLRTFVSPNQCIRNIRFGAKIILRTDRLKFTIALYTSTVIIDALARTTPLFSSRQRLETALKEVWPGRALAR